ncbi:MAG: glutathione transferase GstA [Pseudomonadota bacterium]|nr:glutathione transferase GstA [Pseudomonadota bacterium]
MDLYIIPGACSLAVNIALREAGVTFNLRTVDPRTKQTDAGEDFGTINSKGYVPALRLDDGQILTENAAILQFVADEYPQAQLAPPSGTIERQRLVEWLVFVNSELHKSFSALFDSGARDEVRRYVTARLEKRLTWLQEQIGAREFLVGTRFTVADAYLFTVLGWGSEVGVGLDRWPDLARYHAGIGARPTVKAALRAEGLL